MTYTYDALTEDPLALVGAQISPLREDGSKFRLVSAFFAAVTAIAIWFFVIAPDEKSPTTLMVEPATDVLESFIQPAADMTSLSQQVGFQVSVPNLKRLGVDVTTIGESEFGGQPAAVMQYEHGSYTFLLYSFNKSGKLIRQMKQVDNGSHHFYVTSGGAVSVVVWKDRYTGYHALAAKSTEQDLLELAENVVTIG